MQVAYEDAEAYARWCGKELPSEAEWEFAARGGLEGAEFAWGDELSPDGRTMANIWRVNFPGRTCSPRGPDRTSPVGTFPANGYGLHDMAGNVWQWTTDWFGQRHAAGCRVPLLRTGNARIRAAGRSKPATTRPSPRCGFRARW